MLLENSLPKGKTQSWACRLEQIKGYVSNIEGYMFGKASPLQSNLPAAYIESVVTDQHLDVCAHTKTTSEVSSFIWMGEEESVSFSVFQRSDVVQFFAGSGVYL